MEFWQKRTKREKIIMVLIVTVVLPVAFYFYLYQPLQQDIQAKEERLSQLQSDFEVEKNLADQKPQLEAEFRKIQSRLTNNNQLVTRETLSELIINLNRLAETNNLKLLVFKPQERKEVKSYVKYPVTLQLGGSYQNMLTYLEDISQLDYLMRVEKVAFSSAAKEKSDNSPLTMGIKVVGYNITESSKGD